jgi:hypothetical protein
MTVISSVGIGDSGPQGRRVSRFFMYLIVPLFLRERFYELERMEALVRSSDVGWVIIRPTGLGKGAATGAYRIRGADSLETSMRVNRADVAHCIVDLVSDTRWDGQAISVFAGP